MYLFGLAHDARRHLLERRETSLCLCHRASPSLAPLAALALAAAADEGDAVDSVLPVAAEDVDGAIEAVEPQALVRVDAARKRRLGGVVARRADETLDWLTKSALAVNARPHCSYKTRMVPRCRGRQCASNYPKVTPQSVQKQQVCQSCSFFDETYVLLVPALPGVG